MNPKSNLYLTCLFFQDFASTKVSSVWLLSNSQSPDSAPIIPPGGGIILWHRLERQVTKGQIKSKQTCSPIMTWFVREMVIEQPHLRPAVEGVVPSLVWDNVSLANYETQAVSREAVIKRETPEGGCTMPVLVTEWASDNIVGYFVLKCDQHVHACNSLMAKLGKFLSCTSKWKAKSMLTTDHLMLQLWLSTQQERER